MAILRAAATANDTLDNTSDTLVDSMTLTPAAGDYLLAFSAEFLTDAASGSHVNTWSVYVGGVQIDHSEREYQEDTSIDDATLSILLTCKVSPNGSQAVEIRHRTESAASPIIQQRREMVLFPISGTDFQDTATADDTLATATWTTVDSMTRTPPAGDYLLTFSTSGTGPSGATLGFRVSVGGTPIAHTERTMDMESSHANAEYPICIACQVSPNGSQVVEVEWSRVAGSGTITVHERTMNLVPTAAADIFQATGTVDDTHTGTDDVQVDDMLITDPGAADYLCLFTASDFYDAISNNVAETVYSVRTGGTKVTDSDRMHEHEGSLDNTDLVVGAGWRVTVAGATDDLQIFWQNQASATEQRTIHERTFVAIREPTAGAVEAAASLVGVGVVTEAHARIRPDSLSGVAVGVIGVTAQAERQGDAALVGVGVLNEASVALNPAVASKVGVGVLVGTTSVVRAAKATLVGEGTVTAQAQEIGAVDRHRRDTRAGFKRRDIRLGALKGRA